MYFSKYARTVNMLVRGDSLTKSMSQYLIDQIEATDNIKVQTHTSVIEARGETSLETLVLKNSITGETKTVAANSLFIFIGARPYTDWLDGIITRDERGFIYTGSDYPRKTRSLKVVFRTRSLFTRNKYPRNFCRGGCASWFG